MGIEPTSEAWEASILPLYDARSRVDPADYNTQSHSPVAVHLSIPLAFALATPDIHLANTPNHNPILSAPQGTLRPSVILPFCYVQNSVILRRQCSTKSTYQKH
jgi:hypothetical protein